MGSRDEHQAEAERLALAIRKLTSDLHVELLSVRNDHVHRGDSKSWVTKPEPESGSSPT